MEFLRLYVFQKHYTKPLQKIMCVQTSIIQLHTYRRKQVDLVWAGKTDIHIKSKI